MMSHTNHTDTPTHDDTRHTQITQKSVTSRYLHFCDDAKRAWTRRAALSSVVSRDTRATGRHPVIRGMADQIATELSGRLIPPVIRGMAGRRRLPFLPLARMIANPI